jgi:hypothetical protein
MTVDTAKRSNFHPIGGLSQQQAEQANTRSFTGDGSPYLKIEGSRLVNLERVRVGTLEVPLSEERIYPRDASMSNFQNEPEALVQVVDQPDGSQVLMRSILSNDGIWQKNVPVFLTGDWEDVPAGEGDGDGEGEGAPKTSSRSRSKAKEPATADA